MRLNGCRHHLRLREQPSQVTFSGNGGPDSD
jgi:hypothetical protein